MSNKIFVVSVWSGIVALGLIAVMVPSAFASHIDFEARRLERAAEREARKAEREAARAAADEPHCTCTARLSDAKPSLSFNGSTLVFVPRVNVDIRLRGDQDGERHTVSVGYTGDTSYTSDDVTEPAGISFSGEKNFLDNASCEGHWRFNGVELTRVPLSGITQTLVGHNQELLGTAHLKTTIAGCGFEEENRQFSFRLRELGNVRIGGWRSVR